MREPFVRVPVLSKASTACAGFGNGGMSEIVAEAVDFMDLPQSVVGIISVDIEKRPFIVDVEGDSMMEAGISDGCRIVVNPAEEVTDGDAALVCFGLQSNVAVKWVYFNKQDGSVEMRSSSLRFPPKTFTAEDIEMGLFRIVGKIMSTLGKPKKGI